MNATVRLLLFCLWLSCLSLGTTGFSSPTLVNREAAPDQRMTGLQLRRQAALRQPLPVTSRAYLLYDVDAGRTLLARNADLALPPASLTKLMTALLVLEAGNLQEQVVVRAADLVGGATMGLRSGESLTVEELLWGLLIPSGNDAAMVLARHTAGSVDAFVERMNRRAAELGLTATHFVNPHGLDAAHHVSSAADLLTLARLGLAYPLLRQIVATPAVTVAGHLLRSTNEALGTFPGADGLKTGTTDAAGQCLIASVTRDGHQVLAVMLGSADRYRDLRLLYTAYQESYTWVGASPPVRLTALDRVFDSAGKPWLLQPEGETPRTFVAAWERSRLRAFRRLNLPAVKEIWQPGMVAGVLEWHLGEQLIGTQTLILR